jgi:hypothetical protein
VAQICLMPPIRGGTALNEAVNSRKQKAAENHADLLFQKAMT